MIKVKKKKRRNKAKTVPGVSVAAVLRDSHQIEFDKDALQLDCETAAAHSSRQPANSAGQVDIGPAYDAKNIPVHKYFITHSAAV